MDRKKFNTQLQELIRVGNLFEQRQWFLGTSGNMSILIQRSPMSFAITASGSDKGNLEESSFVVLDEDGKIYTDETALENLKPSHEHPIHAAIYRLHDAECVIHVHVLSALLAADLFAGDGDVSLEGLEVLKGLGCTSASDSLRIPTIDNSDDPAEIARQIIPFDSARKGFTAPAILVRCHGLFAWGKSIFEARRHVELLVHAFEYLVAKEYLGKS